MFSVSTLAFMAVAWAAVRVVVSVFVWALGRAAAIGDRTEEQTMRQAQASRCVPTRTGANDRRASRRPWGSQTPGRRSGDALRWEAEEARQALITAEARLAAFEADHGNDAA